MVGKSIAIVSGAVLLVGCAYNATAPVTPAYDVFSNYEEPVPGNFALHVNGDDVVGDFRVRGFVCSAHSFPFDGRDTFELSVQQTLENLIENIEIVDRPLTRSELHERQMSGQISVEARDFDVELRTIQGFWSVDMDAEAQLAATVTVDSPQGRVFGTTVAGDGDDVGHAGIACEGGATAISLAAGAAFEDVLQRLGERLSNSDRVRDLGKPDDVASRAPDISTIVHNAVFTPSATARPQVVPTVGIGLTHREYEPFGGPPRY